MNWIKKTSNQGVIPIPVDNLTAPVNQEVSITNKSKMNIATNNTLPPVFNFNSCIFSSIMFASD